MSDYFSAARDVVFLLQNTMVTEQIKELRDNIYSKMDREFDWFPLAKYVADLISEREENGNLARKPCIVKYDYDDDVSYTVLEVFDNDEAAEAKLEEWQEKFFPRYGVDIMHLFR